MVGRRHKDGRALTANEGKFCSSDNNTDDGHMDWEGMAGAARTIHPFLNHSIQYKTSITIYHKTMILFSTPLHSPPPLLHAPHKLPYQAPAYPSQCTDPQIPAHAPIHACTFCVSSHPRNKSCPSPMQKFADQYSTGRNANHAPHRRSYSII